MITKRFYKKVVAGICSLTVLCGLPVVSAHAASPSDEIFAAAAICGGEGENKAGAECGQHTYVRVKVPIGGYVFKSSQNPYRSADSNCASFLEQSALLTDDEKASLKCKGCFAPARGCVRTHFNCDMIENGTQREFYNGVDKIIVPANDPRTGTVTVRIGIKCSECEYGGVSCGRLEEMLGLARGGLREIFSDVDSAEISSIALP